jgi:cystathionine gamma-synthase
MTSFEQILDRFLSDRFPYTDTLKILQKWGPGCHFLGLGIDSDIDRLEILLEEEFNRNPAVPPILALFTEFPSNPLLRSANLPRLRALADKYDFLIVIDETIGNFVNVEVLPYADIVVSSLTKVFSGASNVMGGRYIYLFFSLVSLILGTFWLINS